MGMACIVFAVDASPMPAVPDTVSLRCNDGCIPGIEP